MYLLGISPVCYQNLQKEERRKEWDKKKKREKQKSVPRSIQNSLFSCVKRKTKSCQLCIMPVIFHADLWSLKICHAEQVYHSFRLPVILCPDNFCSNLYCSSMLCDILYGLNSQKVIYWRWDDDKLWLNIVSVLLAKTVCAAFLTSVAIFIQTEIWKKFLAFKSVYIWIDSRCICIYTGVHTKFQNCLFIKVQKHQ